MEVRSASGLQTLHSLFKPQLARLNSHSLVWSANRMSQTEMLKEDGNCLKQIWASTLEIGHRDSLVHSEAFNSTKTQPRQLMTKPSQGRPGPCALKERDKTMSLRQKRERYSRKILKLREQISATEESWISWGVISLAISTTFRTSSTLRTSISWKTNFIIAVMLQGEMQVKAIKQELPSRTPQSKGTEAAITTLRASRRTASR